jgi:hypothetical protein
MENNIATANDLYSTTGTVHSRYYSKQTTRQFETTHQLPAACTKQLHLTHAVQSETILAEQ